MKMLVLFVVVAMQLVAMSCSVEAPARARV